jgi:hypothetical protein
MIKPNTDQEEKKNETKKTEGQELERRVGRSSNSTQEKK